MPERETPEQQRHRALEVYERTRAQLDSILAPAKFDAVNDLAAFAAALRKHSELVNEAMEYQEREWIIATGKPPPDKDVDYRQTCMLMRETAERLGLSGIPPLPEPPVSRARLHVYSRRLSEAAEQVAGGTAHVVLPDNSAPKPSPRSDAAVTTDAKKRSVRETHEASILAWMMGTTDPDEQARRFTADPRTIERGTAAIGCRVPKTTAARILDEPRNPGLKAALKRMRALAVEDPDAVTRDARAPDQRQGHVAETRRLGDDE